MEISRDLISVSGFSGDDVTLEEFKTLPQSKSRMGQLFLSLLEMDWGEEMKLSGKFPLDKNHCVWIYCDLFHKSPNVGRALYFDVENGVPSIDKIKKKIYESLRKRTSSIEESVETLWENHEKILERGRRMQLEMTRKFFENYNPPIKIETESTYEYHIFFVEAGEQGRIFRLWLSGHFSPAIFLIDREIYLEHMVRRNFPEKHIILHEGYRFN